VLSDAERQRCIVEDPPLYQQGDDHRAACHFAEGESVV
jgi:hypothetical protein